jgi:hypothetical protein
MRGASPCEQLEVKTNRTSLLRRNRNGHHNTELTGYIRQATEVYISQKRVSNRAF